MQRNSVLDKVKGKKEETGKEEGDRTSKGKNGENQESRYPRKNEVEREVKEDGKDDGKNEGKVGDRGFHSFI